MKIILLLTAILLSVISFSQESDSLILRQIFENAITNQDAYKNLEYLCTEAPGRLVGSPESLKALEYMKQYAESIGCDTVYMQEYVSKAWRCDSTVVYLMLTGGLAVKLDADAIGPSPATPEHGVSASVVEVMGLDELQAMGEDRIRGKIVFFNRPMKQTFVNTFQAYGNAADQRYRGPGVAASMGAVAVIVRSLTAGIDNFPHTGSTRFDSLRIPAVAVSTMAAETLSAMLKNGMGEEVLIRVDVQDLEPISTYNLIAEIRGTEKPEEIIVVGGHIDAWFNSPGAHDDGGGCVQSMDVLRVFKELGIRNKHTIRAVMFMDEELYQGGGKAYADYTHARGERTFFALEADAGAFTPEGFMVDAPDSVYRQVAAFRKLLAPYGIHYIRKGGTGVDIAPLKAFHVPLSGFRTDSQRYFDLHHSANDTFDKINFRELELGITCMAGLIFLIDQKEEW
ncbi:MAG: M20/M25/M40 family metallo-hydrolase [Bacteroidetes bacterium]|nr:M20/M25/M40 family metallo-hydrolase [Bacteroidota bacterium]